MDILQGDDEVARSPEADSAERLESGDHRGESRELGAGAKIDADRTLKGGDLQAYIGRQLRAVYDDVARQPIPDRFVELMKKLEAAGS